MRHLLGRLPLLCLVLMLLAANGVVLAAVNQPPVITVPSTLQWGLPNSTINISNSLHVSDPDAGSEDVTLLVVSTHGGFIWDYSLPAGTVETSDTAVDSLASLNAALDGMVFVPDPGFAGTATITMLINDNGNTGTPPTPMFDAAEFDIQVCAAHELSNQTNCEFNHAPFNVLPSPAPNTGLSTTVGISVSVDDGDVGLGTMDMELDVQHHNGALLPSQVGWLTWDYGSFVTSDTATDTLADLNSALGNLTFTPVTGFAGQARIVFESDDNGNSGLNATEKSDTDFIIIDVCASGESSPTNCATNNNPVNHLVNPVPDTTIGTTVAIPMSVSDIDVGMGTLDMEIDVQHHNGALPPSSVGTFSWPHNLEMTSDLATATLGSMNFYLANLTFTPAPGFVGQARIVFEIDDNGNSGSLGPADEKSDTDFIVIDVVEPSNATFNTALEGRGTPPNANYIEVLDVVITPSAGGVPVFNGTRTTNLNGQFAVGNLLPGNYKVWVKGPHSLAVAPTLTLNAGSVTLNVGTLREGDANDDNGVNIQDFSILAAAFGTSSGGAGFDVRADFNSDDIISISDFSLLAANFGQIGAS
ncbi:MAG: hypothetical protein IPK19_36210 [Chloroflexi bacterium]|nr:hypothetical protein [Chloroflexota bacterium]